MGKIRSVMSLFVILFLGMCLPVSATDFFGIQMLMWTEDELVEGESILTKVVQNK